MRCPLLCFVLAGACALAFSLAACGGNTTGASHGDGGASSSGSSSGSASSGGGGSSGGSSGGGSGSSSGATTGCDPLTTTASTVDPTMCTPQLASTTSCGGQACSWIVEVPCLPDGGLTFDAGDAGDDGSIGSNSDACRQVCNAGAPAGANEQFDVCSVQPLDGGSGLLVSCGGCGI